LAPYKDEPISPFENAKIRIGRPADREPIEDFFACADYGKYIDATNWVLARSGRGRMADQCAALTGAIGTAEAG
jgi:hypothetical protein